MAEHEKKQGQIHSQNPDLTSTPGQNRNDNKDASMESERKHDCVTEKPLPSRKNKMDAPEAVTKATDTTTASATKASSAPERTFPRKEGGVDGNANSDASKPPKQQQQKQQMESATAAGAGDGGNDQVTQEIPRQPLAGQNLQQQQQQQPPPLDSNPSASLKQQQQQHPSQHNTAAQGKCQRNGTAATTQQTSSQFALSQHHQQQPQAQSSQDQRHQQQQQRSVHEEQIGQQRNVLVERYAPYIAPSDRSLQDARNRLKTALEQTRQLRSAFTERVYGKYRVCLKPPATAQEIIDHIRADPMAARQSLEQEIAQIKEEKEFEKREAQALNQDLSKMDASALSVSADNAEQLMYISAGLSLVILPEANVDPKLVAGYPDRAPINPATGQRVRSISQAAAAAGEVILDRARKGAAMRQEWLRRRDFNASSSQQLSHQQPQQHQEFSPINILTSTSTSVNPTPSPVTNNVPSTLDSRLIQARASTAVTPSQTQTAAAPSQSPSTPSLLQQQVANNVGWSTTGTASPAFPMPPIIGTEASAEVAQTSRMRPPMSNIGGKAPPAGSAKGGKARSAPGIPVNISLSLNPTADELVEPDKKTKRRASTTALMTLAVGSSQGIARASPQQRLRHPHPDSMGGRQRANNPTAAKKELATLVHKISPDLANNGPHLQSYLRLALPPLPTPLERRRRKPLQVLDHQGCNTARAQNAIQSVLSQFQKKPEQPMTKIALLHGIQKSSQQNNGDANTYSSSNQQRPIDQTLAILVLQAVGLIAEKENKEDRKRKFPTHLDNQMEHLKASNENNLSSFKALHSTWGKLSPSKRPRFSDAFRLGEGDSGGTSAVEKRATSRSPELASIRGGGELLSETNNDSTSGLPDADGHKSNSTSGSRHAENSMPPNDAQQMRWDESSRAMMNNSYLGPNHSQSIPPVGIPRHYQNHHHRQHPTAENSYHHQPRFSAFQFAQQLRHATNAMIPGDMGVSNYIGGLHNPAHWNMGGNSAHAMAAAQSSLAALGLSGPIGMYNNVQDRATRDLMAREQQNAAAARAVAAHQQSMSQNAYLGGAANPGFSPPLSSMQRPAAPSGDVMNHSTSPSYASSPMMSPVTTNVSQTYENRRKHGQAPATSQENNTQGHAKRSEKQHNAGQGESKDVTDSQKKGVSDQNSADEVNNAVKLQPSENDQVQGQAPPAVDNGASTPSAPSLSGGGGSKQGGLTFYLPKTPHSLSSEEAQLIQQGRFHEVVARKAKAGQQPNAPAMLEYLVAVATAVPIPKAFVLNSLKERLNIPGFKNVASSAGFNIPREVIVAVILVWLWNYHESDFQHAFAKSGRIDVDPVCKWLVQAAVDASVRALTLYIANSGMVKGSRSNKGESASKDAGTERLSENPPNLDLVSASVVGKALTTESCVSDEVDNVLPQFHSLVQFLDECRVCALQSRSQERVLLACLISLKSVMSESFAHAYVSSMVRAGDALGHDRLGDIVLDDELKISSMLPYDIYKDEQGAWEDPCRPEEGFTPNLAGDVLTKTAHARAMIQKSLRRLQDRNSIKGGTPNSGAYTDLSTGQSSAVAAGSAGSVSGARSASGSGGGTPRDRSLNKRKVSSFSEVPCPSGTGSAQATSWALYEPKHFSAPLPWNATDAANSPYGRHPGERQRAMSMSQYGSDSNPPVAKKQKRSMSFSSKTSDPKGMADNCNLARSTHEIDWRDVASYFNRVRLPPPSLSPEAHSVPAFNALKTIVSPFCRKLECSPEPSDGESDDEEDLSEEAILARHQVVLDEMKEKLTAFMEARKKQQERRKKKEKTL